LPVWLENAYSRPKNWGFGGYFTPPPRYGEQYQRTPRQKSTSAGRNGSRGVLIMSVSSTVPEKSRGNKKYDEEELEKEELRHIFDRFSITAKWQ